MIQVYPDEALVQLLIRMTNDDVQYILFENNVTIDRDTIQTDLEEVSTFDYERVTVEGEDWVAGGVTAHQGTIIAPPISFTPNGGDWTVYGYAAYGAGDLLLWAGNFDGAPLTVLDGEPLVITPVVGDRSKLP